MLVDSVDITIRAGKGGDGIVAWRREKFVPMGGPDGGDGGRGGSVWFLASNNIDTLSGFRYRKVFQAADGERGRSKKQHGKAASDLELLVPVGTRVTDETTERLLADLTENNQRFLVAKGGHGGLGNPHFATSTHQKPEEQTNGKPGQVKKLRLDLQLVADIALLGKPNAGKSSIIAALTGAEARIGAYPFSTTEPILGVAKEGTDSLTLVDLPGLIAGAHKGKGLGDQFLKHLSRVKAIAHVVEATETDLAAAIEEIDQEVSQFNQQLSHKKKLIVINKTDLLDSEGQKALQKKYPAAVLVSALTKHNLDKLRQALFSLIP